MSQASMKFTSRLVTCLACVGSAVALVPLTSTALQADIVSSNLLDHANVLQIIASWTGGKRSHGTAGYNISVAYFKYMLDYTGFYDIELLPVTSKDVTFTALSISDSTPTSYTDFDPLFGSPAGLVTGTFRVISNGGCTSVSAQASGFRQVLMHPNRPIIQPAPLANSLSFEGVLARSLPSCSWRRLLVLLG